MNKFKELGFEVKEVDQIVIALNQLLANYQVHYQKLRNFHWNVEGDRFFEVHEQLEIEYNDVKLRIDKIAERIRVFGKKPTSTLKEYLETSDIEERSKDFPSNKMIGEVINDMNILISRLVEAYEAAVENGDIGTSDMITRFLKKTEERRWMLTAYNKDVK